MMLSHIMYNTVNSTLLRKLNNIKLLFIYFVPLIVNKIMSSSVDMPIVQSISPLFTATSQVMFTTSRQVLSSRTVSWFGSCCSMDSSALAVIPLVQLTTQNPLVRCLFTSIEVISNTHSTSDSFAMNSALFLAIIDTNIDKLNLFLSDHCTNLVILLVCLFNQVSDWLNTFLYKRGDQPENVTHCWNVLQKMWCIPSFETTNVNL